MHMFYDFCMRTTMDLPEELIEEARTKLGFRSKTDTIIHSLKEIVRRSKLDELKDLFGKVEFDVDPLTLRGKPAPPTARKR
jgi:hypothetical protein